MGHPIENLIAGVPSLGSYASVLAEIEAVLDNPQSTLTDVGEVIEKDPDLTARLLKLGNSSFYGFPCRVETVSETISLIGIQQVQDLITVSTVVEIFEGISADLVNMKSFWQHSLACGVAARQLALSRRMPKPEKLFVLGLLHDIGRLVLYAQDPEKSRFVFKAYPLSSESLRETEREVLGFDHTEIGECLLRAWNYPANLVAGVRYHHHPLSAGAFQLEASITHVADHLVNAMQWGSSGQRVVPTLHDKAWERLNLPPDVLESVVTAMDDQLAAVEKAFLPAKGGTG
ncbi:MAG TPA: HDOD domain-containing protein [Candidatus Paceibacterota bacterium]|nr:HDOD domain-containing protein [Verrucomicrobiota bacterium]HRY49301.1 HDOD domain-containing protein [Candidatus Paceibacterota bacterium]HSA01848.1 HDOD domain-containing protein [Candidatus Paceibacterota bacterium]